ncbi:MAG: hypothetical protein AAF236_08190, partial [Verrucomicrobiota bacterium]
MPDSDQESQAEPSSAAASVDSSENEAGFLPGDIEQAETEEPTASPEPAELVEEVIEEASQGDFEALAETGLSLIRLVPFWIDIGLVIFTALAALLVVRLTNRGKLPWLAKAYAKIPSKRPLSLFRICLVSFSWIALLGANIAGLICPALRFFSLLVTFFFFLNLPSKFLAWKTWMTWLTTAVFVVIVMHALGVLDDVLAFLDSQKLDLGSFSLTTLDVLKGILTFTLLFWLAGLISKVVTHRLGQVHDLDPNVRVLFTKAIRVGFFAVAIVMTLGVMGVKITTLAVFGGALGLGLGFGLQKVVSNIVSGVILLLDKSIKPG